MAFEYDILTDGEGLAVKTWPFFDFDFALGGNVSEGDGLIVRMTLFVDFPFTLFPFQPFPVVPYVGFKTFFTVGCKLWSIAVTSFEPASIRLGTVDDEGVGEGEGEGERYFGTYWKGATEGVM